MEKYKVTFNTWNKIADLYQEKFMDLDLYNETYDLFCQKIDRQNPRILEIGCGPGNITKYLLVKKPAAKILATDVAPNMIQLARENNPNADFQLLDCRFIAKLNERFDAIICGFCLPYLAKADVVKLINDCASLLNPEGIFYLSTIEGNYDKSGCEKGSTGDEAYVYYYEKAFIKMELENSGFANIFCQEKNYRKNEEEEVHLIFIAEKAKE